MNLNLNHPAVITYLFIYLFIYSCTHFLVPRKHEKGSKRGAPISKTRTKRWEAAVWQLSIFLYKNVRIPRWLFPDQKGSSRTNPQPVRCPGKPYPGGGGNEINKRHLLFGIAEKFWSMFNLSLTNPRKIYKLLETPNKAKQKVLIS